MKKYIAILLLVALGVAACDKPAEELRWQGQTMGTYYQIRLLQPTVPKDMARLKNDIEELLNWLESLLSHYQEESEVSRINRLAIGTPMVVARPTFEVLEAALEVGKLGQGSFDVTVAPLVELWGFGTIENSGSVPNQEQIDAALALIGQRFLVLGKYSLTVTKTQPITINLSALAKGYGVDKVAQYLEQQGVDNYFIEIGGEVKVKGVSRSGKGWRIGIEEPFVGKRNLHRIIYPGDAAVATSGDYRNYFIVNDKRYSHTIDPLSGRPVDNSLASVTVVHPKSAMLADAYATLLTVLGAQKGLEFAQQHKLAAYFIVRDDENMSVIHSSNFVSYLSPESL